MASGGFVSGLASPSLASLFIETLNRDREVLSTATGFVYREQETDWLVTNLHVMTGLHPYTGQPLSGSGEFRPTHLRITYPRMQDESQRSFQLPLVDEGLNPLFRFERSGFDDGKDAFSRSGDPFGEELPDVAIIEMPSSEKFYYKNLCYTSPGKISLSVTDSVFVVGYPGNAQLRPGHLPAWTRATIASEPSVGWRGPRLLVDARTRPGQSGSPVVSYRRSMSLQTDGGFREDLPESVRLIGIYSGRTDHDSDLGSVWHLSSIWQAIHYG